MSTNTKNNSPDVATARMASRLRTGVLIVFGVILLLYVVGRLGLHIGRAGVLFRSHLGADPSAGYLGDGIMLLLAISIYWLAAALKSIAKGALFTRQTIRQFRQFALWLMIMALYSSIAPMLLDRARLGEDLRHKVLIALDVKDLLLVGVTALLFLITRLLERAGEIEQENREIV